jgi:hypothetical protein
METLRQKSASQLVSDDSGNFHLPSVNENPATKSKFKTRARLIIF